MELNSERRKEFGKQIVETVLQALSSDTVSVQEASQMSRYILDNIIDIKTDADLVTFAKSLAEKWQLFQHLATMEEGYAQEAKEDAVANKVEELTQSGNLDEALNLAKSATQ